MLTPQMCPWRVAHPLPRSAASAASHVSRSRPTMPARRRSGSSLGGCQSFATALLAKGIRKIGVALDAAPSTFGSRLFGRPLLINSLLLHGSTRIGIRPITLARAPIRRDFVLQIFFEVRRLDRAQPCGILLCRLLLHVSWRQRRTGRHRQRLRIAVTAESNPPLDDEVRA